MKVDTKFLREINRSIIQTKESTLLSRNLTALTSGEARVVVTGQQTSLFLGPLFNLPKIISTIKYAKEIEEQTKKPCVPVFWLQNEDHDIEEINFINISDPHGIAKRITVEIDNRKISVKNRALGDDINRALTELGENSLSTLLNKYYTPDSSWSDAFGKIVAEMFADYGLIVFDPRTKFVAETTIELYLKTLSDWKEIATCLTKDTVGLAKAVHVREDSPIFFLHKENPLGERFRLKDEDGVFSLIGDGSKITPEEIKKIIETEPLRVSSSALLRPLIQNYLLPIDLYVGGLAEVNYWKQLPSLHKYFDVQMPKIEPRISIRLIEQKIDKLLGDLSLTASMIEEDPKRILEKLLACDSQAEPLKAELIDQINLAFKNYETKIKTQNKNLLSKIDETSKNVRYLIEKLSNNYKKAIIESNKALSDKIARLQKSLFPDNQKQERFYGLCSFTQKYEISYLIDKMIKETEHKETKTQDINLW